VYVKHKVHSISEAAGIPINDASGRGNIMAVENITVLGLNMQKQSALCLLK
jgi:hypothetical protein